MAAFIVPRTGAQRLNRVRSALTRSPRSSRPLARPATSAWSWTGPAGSSRSNASPARSPAFTAAHLREIPIAKAMSEDRTDLAPVFVS